MKCFACHEVECPVGVMFCATCKAAQSRWQREQSEQFRQRFNGTITHLTDNRVEALKLLGVSKNASQDEIKKAYRQKAVMLHPDHGGKHEEMVQLNKAYELVVKRGEV